MKVRYEKKEQFQVLGRSIKTKNIEGQNNQDIPKFWTDINTNGDMKKLWNLLDNPIDVMYGICLDNPEGETDPTVFIYAAGIHYTGGEKQDFEIFDIPAAQWAIFSCKGPMPHAIQKVWTDIFTKWLPENEEYEIAPLPQIEYYPAGDPNSQDYYTEVWIPIIKK